MKKFNLTNNIKYNNLTDRDKHLFDIYIKNFLCVFNEFPIDRYKEYGDVNKKSIVQSLKRTLIFKLYKIKLFIMIIIKIALFVYTIYNKDHSCEE